MASEKRPSALQAELQRGNQAHALFKRIAPPLQIEALLAGVNRKLMRAAMDWVCLEEMNCSDTMPFCVAGRFRLSTIKSLHNRGLLSANFDDPRLHHSYWKGVENMARKGERRSLSTPMVWTSKLGRELLCAKNLLPESSIDNVIPFPNSRTRRPRPHLRREAEIVDLASCRGDRNRGAA